MSQVVVNPYWFVSAAGNGPDGTQNYVAVTIQSSQVDSALTDFPVYVDLSDMPAAFFTNVQSDGGDIRVTEDDGTTKAPVDLVSIDTGGSAGELHFKASSVSASSNTTYRVYYNATSTLSQPAVGDTYGRNAVWSDYQGVWHMEEDPSGGADSIIDSTGNGNHGTPSGMAAGDSITGKVGNGLNFNGGDYVEVADDPTLTLTNSATVSAWAKVDTYNADDYNVFLDKTGLTGGNDQYLLIYDNRSSQGSPQLARWQLGGGGSDTETPADWDAVGTVIEAWTLLHGTMDGSNNRIYGNGSLKGTGSGTLLDGSDNTLALRFGHISGSTGVTLNGAMDEVRISRAVRAADWIAAEHTNQNAPTTFYSVSSEQAA